MKNQLLEDFGDSQSSMPVRPVRRVQAVASPPPPPTVAPEPPPRQHAGVWRSRPSSPPPPAFSPDFTVDVGSFSSPEPDWRRPLPPEPAHWTERWGRKALGWTAGLAAAVAVAAGGTWMVRETQVENTLAVVADHSPAPSSVAPPVAPVEALPEPEPAPLPPLRLLPPGPVAVAPQPVAPAVDDKVIAKAEPRPAKKPVVAKPAAKKTAPKPARETVVARAPVVPPRTEPDPQSPLAETLRMCRAAGYHATACLKRGCEATRFGLVCRG